MDWFRRVKKSLLSTEKKEIPNGLWVKCPSCSEILYKRELEKSYYVCPNCRHHFQISCSQYLHFLMDSSYKELFTSIRSTDPLRFKALKKYSDQLKAARSKTGSEDAVRIYEGSIEKYKTVLCIMDFKFIGGSMGSVVGEKIARAIDYADENNLPLIILSQSGGARMMEGALSLMQMAKTSAKLAKYHENGGLFISILTDPTTGGVTASYAMLGDIIIAEPGALIGFAGPRVIKQTIGHELPEGFQRAEFLLEKGFVDMIVERNDLKNTVIQLLDFFYGEKFETADSSHK